MKKAFIRSVQVASLSAAALFVAPSCTKDLDRTPTYDLSADVVYKDAAGYKTQLAKVYSCFAVTGPGGPTATSGDIIGIDQGTSDYLRQYWSAQEMTTDEAVCFWGSDPGVQDWHNFAWTSQGVLIRGLYSRMLYTITICNSYLQESTADKLSARGIGSGEAADIANYRAEVRFLRALTYYHLMDLYGNPPYADETFPIATTAVPSQITRADLYKKIESELQAIDGDLKAPGASEYGRATKAAAYALLAKMYLNGVTYAGASAAPACYTNAAAYARKVIDNTTYSLLPNGTSGNALATNGYGKLFLADNQQNNPEVIFPILYDGKVTQSYGGTTFLIHGAFAGKTRAGWSSPLLNYGIGGGWGGLSATPSFYQQFPDTTADERGRFHVKGQTADIVKLPDEDNYYGYVPVKFRNITSAGAAGSDLVFTDTDFPMLRLADVYLTYAEAVARGGTGSIADALTYVNRVRNRAYRGQAGGNAGAVVTDSLTNSKQYTFFLRERARELFWEATRRTDLIRFGKFTKNYNWQWKGGTMNGTNVDDHYQLLPIPSSEISINPNLRQNAGY